MNLLTLHIIIAVAGIIAAGATFRRPTTTLFRLSYALVGGTLASGTLLVLMSPSHLASACLSGLAYLAFVGATLAVARAKYATH